MPEMGDKGMELKIKKEDIWDGKRVYNKR